jgi:thiamine kinase-like enzyme
MSALNKPALVLKHINPPAENNHPRGWNSDAGHQRKLKSYQVELAWYNNYSARLDGICKIPRLLSSESISNQHLLILEDLNSAGYPITNPQIDIKGIKTVLKWLAKFHAIFLNTEPDQLWKTGCYWHLETRKEEWQKMHNSVLKSNAKSIDDKLSNASFQTFVHGDAKLANFCFSTDQKKVAAVDFQYIGKGCGIKDVAYFLGSCLSESECQLYEIELLDCYFDMLQENLKSKISEVEITKLSIEWRNLYAFAWADFHRFLEGWAPNHQKLNRYSQSKVDQVIRKL